MIILGANTVSCRQFGPKSGITGAFSTLDYMNKGAHVRHNLLFSFAFELLWHIPYNYNLSHIISSHIFNLVHLSFYEA